MNIFFTEYLEYRAKMRGFNLKLLEEILRYSSERYLDTETGRLIVVGKHGNELVMIPFEIKDKTIVPITVHATTRQQIKFRLQTGRLIYEPTPLF
jgi:hypothetical protein